MRFLSYPRISCEITVKKLMEFRQNNGEGIPKAFLCVEN